MNKNFTLEQLLITSPHRNVKLSQFMLRESDYHNIIQTDKETFFRYLERLGIAELVKSYISDKKNLLSESFRPLITYIFKLNQSGKTKTYKKSKPIVISCKNVISGKPVGKIIGENFDREKVRRKLDIDLMNMKDNELRTAYSDFFLILNHIFESEEEPLKTKYNNELQKTDLYIFYHVNINHELSLELKGLPFAIMDNSNLSETDKKDLLINLEESFLSFLDLWDYRIKMKVEGKEIPFVDESIMNIKISD